MWMYVGVCASVDITFLNEFISFVKLHSIFKSLCGLLKSVFLTFSYLFSVRAVPVRADFVCCTAQLFCFQCKCWCMYSVYFGLHANKSCFNHMKIKALADNKTVLSEEVF